MLRGFSPAGRAILSAAHALASHQTTLNDPGNLEDSTMAHDDATGSPVRLRSQLWFDNPDDPDMTALYVERYLNWGLTRDALQSGKPLIGIAQSGPDLAPCNRQHLE